MQMLLKALILTCAAFPFGSSELVKQKGTHLPENLKVPKGHKLKYHVYAKGDQVYICSKDNQDTSKFVWSLIEPIATLYADSSYKQVVGKHFAGPTWQSIDGSKVLGVKIAEANSPDINSISWLLLKYRSSDGIGVFDKVSFIQRINTLGGKVPTSNAADKKHQNLKINIPYFAEYFFYVPE